MSAETEAGMAAEGMEGAAGAAVEGGEAAGIADAGNPDTDAPGGGSPDVWELSPSEDFPVPEENLQSFSAACRGAGLSREQAEKILDWHKGQFRESQGLAAQEEARVLEGWRTEILADRDFGGASYKATVADARRALAAFDPDGKLRAFLRESRWQHNPDVIRVAARVGRAMGEHGFVGRSGAGRQDKPLEERMYPDMKF